MIAPMRVSDFDYEFPPESIALHPPKNRGQSRLLVLNRDNGEITHRRYSDFVDYVEVGDVVVLNDTKVIRARLTAQNSQGNNRELLLVEKHGLKDDGHVHRCLYRGKIEAGEVLHINKAEVRIERLESEGIALVKSEHDLFQLAEQYGSVPLPPYMKRQASAEDVERYQTLFAREAGSVAAPTASLNFTEALKKQLEVKGALIVYLTLHVGLGTFLPIRTYEIEGHKMHSEYFEIPANTVKAIQQARTNGHKVTAVGTTVTRTLEFAASCHPELVSGSMPSANLSGEADIFIYPGYKFQMIDQLLAN